MQTAPADLTPSLQTTARTLLIVAAEPRELRGIAWRCAGVTKLRWPVWFARSGRLGAYTATLVANGPGPKLATTAIEAAIGRGRPDVVISTGYCGALDEALGAGEVLVATGVDDGEISYQALLPRVQDRPYQTGKVLSLPFVVVSTREKRRLRERGPVAVDMEAAAVASVACRHGLPFFCIRAVLDRAEEGFDLDFNSLRGADGRFSRALIIKAALKKPFARVPELVRLERRGRLASRALGDFIADCRF